MAKYYEQPIARSSEGTPYLVDASGKPQIFYHGTKNEYASGEIAEGHGILRRGIYLAHEEGAAALYGKVRQYVIKAKPEEVLDLSDGDVTWGYMKANGILDEADLQDVDLEKYVRNGQIFQYDISTKRGLADDIIGTAKEQGYKVVRLADDLSGMSDNIATVVTSADMLIPAEQEGTTHDNT